MTQVTSPSSIADYHKRVITSRERPKSAPYPRLKIAKGLQSVNYSLIQYPYEEKIEILQNTFWSPVSRIVPKNVKGDLEKPK